MKKKIFALAISMIMILSVFPVSAFAAEQPVAYTQNAIENILAEINTEYGTNIHILTDAERQKNNVSTISVPVMTDSELADLENELRHIAEYEIPEFERTTQEAKQAIARINERALVSDAMQASINVSYNPIYAVKAIDYATAVAEAYITTDYYGNTVWGSVVDKECVTDRTQARWFYAANPTVSRIDLGRTLYWVGEGDYCATISGVVYVLSSGTQYAEMYVGNYCN